MMNIGVELISKSSVSKADSPVGENLYKTIEVNGGDLEWKLAYTTFSRDEMGL